MIITCMLAFNPHELLIRDWPLSDARHSALYILKGLDFDPNLKANLNNNHKL